MSEQFSRRCAVLVVDVDLDRPPRWDAGPLPFTDGATVADRDARRRYFNERAGQALYGPNRLHQWSSSIEPPVAGFKVLGVELLRVHGRRRTRNALLVVHGALETDGSELVESLANLAHVGPAESASRTWYDRLLADSGRVEANVRRAATLALVTPAGQTLEPPLAEPSYDGWSPELQWLWLLASATPADAYRPPPDWVDRLTASLVRLSAGWRGLVLRDGAALLGSGGDMSAVYRLSPDPELHFRSIYLDALLLGHVQRLRLSQFADDLAALGDPVRHPELLSELENEVTEFRNVFWWQQLGPHWHGNELLRAYQRQHEIPELFAQVVKELQDYSGQARTAATLRTSALLGILSIVGLPFSLSVGIIRALGIEDWYWVLASLGAAAAVAGAILATRTGRALVRPLLLVRRRRSAS